MRSTRVFSPPAFATVAVTMSVLAISSPRTLNAQQRAYSATSPASTNADSASRPKVRVGDWMLSVNPLGLVAGGLSGEAERRLGGTHTAALATTYWGTWGANYLSVDAKLRFYQRKQGTKVLATETVATDFEGLSLYPMVGFQSIWATGCSGCGMSGVTVGGGLDYGWRLGEEKQFAVIAGVGVKTGFYGSYDEDVLSAHLTYPFVRLGLGYVLKK